MRRALLLTLALGGGALAGGHKHGGGHAGHGVVPTVPTGSVAELKTLRGRAFDVAFLGAMIVHHQMAVDMAKSELTAGRDARVKAAAQQVVTAQRREITLMNSWLQKWSADAARGGSMSMAGPRPGESWDRWFLTGMIPHHRGAVEMAKLVPTRTQNPQLRQLAASIIKSQTAEINQYRAWLKVVK